uniref:Kazal-like domain-containing protein n=1 Tax=Photinus pyralis TaxID=7054 RepID=A0A1Y1KZP5_PHOPY
MKVLAIIVVCLAVACNAQKYKRCRAQKCDDVEVQRQQLIKFPFGCLNSDYLSEWRKCVLNDDQTVDCPQDKFNKCTKQIAVRHDKGCDKCDVGALKNSIDQLQKINFSCFCTRFLGYFNKYLGSNDWDNDKCPGHKLNKYFQDAYDNLPDV